MKKKAKYVYRVSGTRCCAPWRIKVVNFIVFKNLKAIYNYIRKTVPREVQFICLSVSLKNN